MSETVFNRSMILPKAWKFSGLLALSGVLVLTSMPVMAQSMSELQNRLRRLENDIQTLNRAVYRGESPAPGSVSGGGAGLNADAEIRMQQLEGELRQMRGKIEELSFENRQLRTELERVSGDLKMQIQDMAGAAPSASPTARANVPLTTQVQSPAAVPTAQQGDSYAWNSNAIEPAAQTLGSISQSPSGAVNPSADSAAALYENAFAQVKNKQYAAAQQGFDDFLGRYPSHALAGNAKYWLGETYYVRGQYDTAARVFAEGYQQYPESSKTADNLLKLGMSLGAMGKPEDACIALGQLSKETGQASGPVIRRAEQERARLGC